MRNPFVSHRTSGDTVPGTEDVPGWVTEFRRWGVPAAAILVLVLCAPGEQHLADLSGWGPTMSWGLSGLFTLYAGLAAVISTQLPKGGRGKTSSVWGAILSLALAMGAQPVSHMFVTGYLSADPRPPLWLVATVSSVPPLILGHLLHFAAMPAGTVSRKVQAERPLPKARTTAPVQPVPASPRPSRAPRTVSPPRVPAVSLIKTFAPASVPVDELSRLRSLTEIIRALRAAGHDKDMIKAIVPTVPGYEGAKDNSINKALRRTA